AAGGRAPAPPAEPFGPCHSAGKNQASEHSPVFPRGRGGFSSNFSVPEHPPLPRRNSPAVAQPAAAPETPRHAAATIVGDYELLGKLGQGGTGVVYRARQRSLNRIVALKMILAGAHADPKLLARFKADAEVVARLTDPNIGQV